MRYYDVEIIVIENMSDEEKNSENWPLQVNLVKDVKMVELGQPVLSEWLPESVDLSESYKELKASQYQLISEVEKLSESKTHRVIFHAAWRQPGLDKDLSLPVHFKREIPAAPVIVDEKSPESNPEQTTTPKVQATPSVLEGILRVTLARYLHLEAELTYQDKLPEVIKTDNPFSILDNENKIETIKKQGVIHVKQERRRIRSNETHYLDHPVLGILVRMTPYEKPEEVNTTTKKQQKN